MPGELAVAGPTRVPALSGPRSLHPFRARRLALPFVGGIAGEADGLVLGPLGVPDQAGREEQAHQARQVSVDPQARLHVHDFTVDGWRVRGLVGLVDLTGERLDHGSREGAGLLPHEAVDPTRVARLTQRLVGLGLDSAPLLLLHREPLGAQHTGDHGLSELMDEATAGPPDVRGRDGLGDEHRLWSVRGTDLLRRLEACVGRGQLLLADGHHRYAAHLDLAGRTPPRGGGRALAMVTDATRLAPRLHPIHRVLAHVTAAEVADALASAGHEVTRGQDRTARPDQPEAAPPGEVLLVSRTEDLRVALASGHEVDAAEQVHASLDAGGQALGSRGWRYHHEASGATRDARDSDSVAVILPPPSLARAWQAAIEGRLLPAKATSFQPKPPPGVLFRAWRDG